MDVAKAARTVVACRRKLVTTSKRADRRPTDLKRAERQLQRAERELLEAYVQLGRLAGLLKR